MCTEYTHPREHPDSRCSATIPVNRKNGPVLKKNIYIYIRQLFGIYGIEVQILSLNWTNQIILHRLWYAEDLRDSWMSCISMTVKFVTSSSLFNQRNDPEHVVTAPEQLCSGKPVRWRQDPENNERDREPFCTQLTGAHRNTSASMVHLSEVNLRTRETRTRVYTKKEVPMPERNWITIFAVHSYFKILCHPTFRRWWRGW